MKTPKSITEMMSVSSNRKFLRRLYRLAPNATKAKRLKVLNSGSKKQRCLLIHIVHQTMIGEIKMRKSQLQDFLKKSQQTTHLSENFVGDDAVRRLLNKTDQEQKDCLAKLTNYHMLLFRVFHVRRS
jgi:hypothetical protein